MIDGTVMLTEAENDAYVIACLETEYGLRRVLVAIANSRPVPRSADIPF